MSKKSKRGVTRQGVRDLNSLPGKSLGRILDSTPNLPEFCNHVNKRECMGGYGMTCDDCGAEWEVKYP